MKTVKVNQSRGTVCNITCTFPVGLRSILPTGSASKMCRYPLTSETAFGINILFQRTALSRFQIIKYPLKEKPHIRCHSINE